MGALRPALLAEVGRLECLGDASGVERIAHALLSDPETPASALANLAACLAGMTRLTTALELAEAARNKAPSIAGIRHGLATLYRMHGRLAEAEDECRAALALDPSDGHCHLLLADLRRFAPDPDHLSTLRQLVARGGADWRKATMLGYALGRELEAAGRFDEALGAFGGAATTFREHLDYVVERDLVMLSSLQNAHTRSSLAEAPKGNETSRMIFVCGLPRSGTSLVEQMLQANPDVLSLGERAEFGAIVGQSIMPPPADRADLPRRALTLDMGKLGHAYVRKMQMLTADPTMRLVDKAPLNFLYAGLISRALPSAKIILVRRNPAAVCAAMYTTYFDGLYPYSYDLEELAGYLCKASRLIDHWTVSIPPDTLRTIQYEELIERPEPLLRELASWLGIPWNEEALKFYTSPKPATSASAVQVRRPIYRDGRDTWRRYEAHLAPALDMLRASGLVAG